MTKVPPKQKFTNARLQAVQAIYAHELTGQDFDAVIAAFVLGSVGHEVLIETPETGEKYEEIGTPDAGLFTRIVKEYADRGTEIDGIIRQSLSEGIALESLEITLRAILRAGISEFYVNPELDAPIIINEYTDIACSFYEGSEVRLVNAVLDRFAKVIKG